MSKQVVREYMTTHPHWIDHQASMKSAMELMTAHQIRHVPVKKGNRVVGLISDRDLKLFLGIPTMNPDHLHVSNISSGEPYIVVPPRQGDGSVALNWLGVRGGLPAKSSCTRALMYSRGLTPFNLQVSTMVNKTAAVKAPRSECVPYQVFRPTT